MIFHYFCRVKEQKTIAIKLKPSAERHALQRHPWVFDQSIVKSSKVPDCGDLAVIFSKSKNTFVALGLIDTDSVIRIKLLSWEPKVRIDKNWFEGKIADAINIRKPLLDSATDSCRLLYGENDGLPGLICDKYGDVLVLKLYSRIWEGYVPMIVDILVHETNASACILRLSRNVSKATDTLVEGSLLHGTLPSPVIQFVEHGVTFETDVIAGHKTGFFLDHRHNRYAVQQLSKSKSVLDVFSYSGGFSTHALVGGAHEVTSVDISQQALKLAQRNVKLNSVDSPLGNHIILVGDAFEILEGLVSKRKRYDIVIIDPPSFAKQASEIVKAKHSYAKLAGLGAQLINKGGTLILASCSSRVTSDDFFYVIDNELSRSGKAYKLLKKTFHDVDHPIGFTEGAYLKCAYYQMS